MPVVVWWIWSNQSHSLDIPVGFLSKSPPVLYSGPEQSIMLGFLLSLDGNNGPSGSCVRQQEAASLLREAIIPVAAHP